MLKHEDIYRAEDKELREEFLGKTIVDVAHNGTQIKFLFKSGRVVTIEPYHDFIEYKVWIPGTPIND